MFLVASLCDYRGPTTAAAVLQIRCRKLLRLCGSAPATGKGFWPQQRRFLVTRRSPDTGGSTPSDAWPHAGRLRSLATGVHVPLCPHPDHDPSESPELG